MRKTFETVALTLASLGLLAASAAPAAPLPQSLRPRGVTAVGSASERPSLSPSALDALRRRWRTPDEEDALSHALLKTMRVRPELFVGAEDDLIRYVEVAARNCLRDLRARSHRKDLALDRPLEGQPGNAAPVDARDLRHELERRLSATERAVLGCLVDDGEDAARAIARQLAITRYQATQALERIRSVAKDLIGEAA